MPGIEFTINNTHIDHQMCDRVTGRVQHGVKSGPDPYLSRAEEDELVNFLLRCASVGYAHT